MFCQPISKPPFQMGGKNHEKNAHDSQKKVPKSDTRSDMEAG